MAAVPVKSIYDDPNEHCSEYEKMKIESVGVKLRVNNETAPVLLWLQGGPGSMSLYGLSSPNTDLSFVNDDLTLSRREYPWTANYSVVYIDNPVGTGFSFSDGDGGYATNQEEVENHMYTVLLQFFQLFPDLQDNDFYITGESYAGIAIGNGLTDPAYQLNYADYMYQLGLVDSNVRERLGALQDFCAIYIWEGNYAAADNFFVSLYGHKLPVLCMDICYDSTLIVTGSADRNVKICGLDFGDCHRSLFAHDDSITAIQFVPKTHHFFTCGKDGRVKYWDADTYNKILTLQAHHGEAWCLAISPNGQFVASSGSDRVVRLFERTSEPVVLEDEAEEEREAEENEALATGEETVVPGQFDLNLPSKKTVGSEKAAERLLEAIDVYKEYKAELLAHKKADDKAPAPQVPILMTAYKTSNPDDFLIEILSGIRASDLEEALLLLPFTTVCEFLSTLPALLARDHEIEVICRTMMFLLRMHRGPIISNQGLLPVIKKLNKLAISKVNKIRDIVGYNSYSLQFVQRDLEERNSVQLFLDATVERKTRDRKRRKRERIAKTAVITL